MDLEALRKGGVAFSSDAIDLAAASRDLWPRSTIDLRRGQLPPRPNLVTWPTDAEQVDLVLAVAGAEGRPVVPYGAGSGVCGGAAGRAGAVVVDTKRMNRILAVDAERQTVHAQAGILGQHLEDQLAPDGWMTAHSPSSVMCSTVGGYVAARSAGQFSSRYGVFDDMLLGAAAVTPVGRLATGVWTPPEAEDHLPLLAGSEGALGVVTDVLLRLAPLPDRRWLRGYSFPSQEMAWDAMRRLMQADLWPSVLRLYGPVDTRVGGPARGARRACQREDAPGLLARLQSGVGRLPGVREHALALPLALPRLVNRLAAGLGSEVLLVVGFEGSDAVVDAVVEAARPILTAGRDLGPEPGEHWYAHRHDVSYKLAPVFVGGGWADTMEVAAPWSRLGDLDRLVRGALARHAFVMAHYSHAYPEGCSIYFSFAGAGDTAAYDATWADALAAAREAGGTVTHHHGVGQLKAREAAREMGAAVRVWHRVKAELDPGGIMNPDRLFPADVPEEPGPPPPTGGPVFGVDRTSLLAQVDPLVAPGEIEAELARRGLALRYRPDRPLGQWLGVLRRGVLHRWETPLFGVQARFEDGVSARISHAPRSAAGPDLRWGLLRQAHPELVQVPVRPLGDGGAEIAVRRVPPTGPHPEDARPAWQDGQLWGFVGPAAAALAEACGGEPAGGTPPLLDPVHRASGAAHGSEESGP